MAYRCIFVGAYLGTTERSEGTGEDRKGKDSISSQFHLTAPTPLEKKERIRTSTTHSVCLGGRYYILSMYVLIGVRGIKL